MNDFLTRLVQRQLGEIATIEPRVAPLYTPTANQFGLQSIFEETEHQPTSRAPVVAFGISPSHSHEMLSRANNLPSKDSLYSHEPVPTESQLNKDRSFKTEVAALIPSKSSSMQESDDLRRRQSELEESGPSPRKNSLFSTITNTTPAAPVSFVNSIKSDSVSFTPRQNQLNAPAALGASGDRLHRLGQQDEDAPVHVTIGRIEVTAVTAAAATKRAPAPRQKGMSLDEYLSRRQRRDK